MSKNVHKFVREQNLVFGYHGSHSYTVNSNIDYMGYKVEILGKRGVGYIMGHGL